LNCNFQEGEAVYVRNYSSGPTWLSGKIVKLTGPVSVEVELEDGLKVRSHFDQLRCRPSTTTGLPERVPLTDHPVVTDESDDYLFMSVPSPDQGVSTDNNSEPGSSPSELVLPRRNPHVTVGPQTDLDFKEEEV